MKGWKIFVKIMSYNIRHGVGVDGFLRLERIADVIEMEKADVIGIQEADKHYGNRSEFKDQMYELALMLDFHYCYGPNLISKPFKNTNKMRKYGNGILSRFPITDYENTPLPSFNKEQRGVLKATIKTEE